MNVCEMEIIIFKIVSEPREIGLKCQNFKTATLNFRRKTKKLDELNESRTSFFYGITINLQSNLTRE